MFPALKHSLAQAHGVLEEHISILRQLIQPFHILMEGIQVAFLALHPSHLLLPSRLLPSGSPFLSNFHIEHQGSNPGLRLLLLDTDLHLPFFHSVDSKLSDSLTLLTSFKDPCIFCVSKWPITCPEPETLEPAKCFFLSSPQPVVTVWSLEFRLC